MPKYGDYDLGMRQALLSSMISHGSSILVTPLLHFQPGPNSAVDWRDQVGDPPLYYWLVSLPMRFCRLWRWYPALCWAPGFSAAGIADHPGGLGIAGRAAAPKHVLRWMTAVPWRCSPVLPM